MNGHWDNLAAATDGLITTQDFESAVYRLVAEQCLYYSDQRSRTAYGIVERYEKEMAKVLAPLGITLKVNRVGHYAVAIPIHVKAIPASAAQTLFALVLRGIFESMATAGSINEVGEVHVDLYDLNDKYRMMTGKEFPAVGEFHNLMRTMQRWGIARKLSEEEASGAGGTEGDGIAIRPGILEVLGETALRRLAMLQEVKASGHDTSTAIEESDENSEVID